MTFVSYVTDERQDIVSLAAHIAGLLDPTLNWRDVDWLRGIWRGPLLLKGVLHPDEARAALDHGIDGVIVSNHGGRQLDGAIAAVRRCRRWSTRSRTGSRCCWTAASGAAATWGAGARRHRLRPATHLWGPAVAGQAGVRVFDILRRDIDRVLALGGWDGVAALDRRALGLPPARPGPSRKASRPSSGRRAVGAGERSGVVVLIRPRCSSGRWPPSIPNSKVPDGR